MLILMEHYFLVAARNSLTYQFYRLCSWFSAALTLSLSYTVDMDGFILSMSYTTAVTTVPSAGLDATFSASGVI
jgi:hypothetical protein